MGGRETGFINRSCRSGSLSDNAAGRVPPNLSHSGGPDHSPADLAIDFVDNHQMGQQRWNIARVDIAPRRHATIGPLGEPIAVEVDMMRYGHMIARNGIF